jgi:DNA-binding protein H-NS
MANNVSYETLMSEIDKLKKQADVLRVGGVIDEIKAQIAEYGLTPQDLFGDDALSTYEAPKVVHSRKKPDVKFKDPVTGATWTGRGKTPKWMQGKLQQGGNKDDFSV